MKSERFALSSNYFLSNPSRWIGRVFSVRHEGRDEFTSTLEAVIVNDKGSSVYFARIEEPIFISKIQQSFDTNNHEFQATSYWD